MEFLAEQEVALRTVTGPEEAVAPPVGANEFQGLQGYSGIRAGAAASDPCKAKAGSRLGFQQRRAYSESTRPDGTGAQQASPQGEQGHHDDTGGGRGYDDNDHHDKRNIYSFHLFVN